jgi:hypothetical protein
MANLPFQSSIRPDRSGTFTMGEIKRARKEDRKKQDKLDKARKLREAIRVANNKPRLRN